MPPEERRVRRGRESLWEGGRRDEPTLYSRMYDDAMAVAVSQSVASVGLSVRPSAVENGFNTVDFKGIHPRGRRGWSRSAGHPSRRRRRQVTVLQTSQGDFANVAIRHRPTPSPHLLMPHSRIYLMPRLSLERSNEADGEWNEMARVLPHLRISPKCHRKDPGWLRELEPARDCELTQLTWSNFTQPFHSPPE